MEGYAGKKFRNQLKCKDLKDENKKHNNIYCGFDIDYIMSEK